ncbi:MAG: efflux RND transporter permease subunit [Pirellulaceae bacterium]
MIFAHWFLNNPRLVLMTILLSVASGVMALITLPRIEDPILTPRFGAVTTVFPGATVERIESLISRKLEEELSDLAELKEVFSYSRPGVSLVIIELRDDVHKQDVPNAWVKVRERIDAAYLKMPPSSGEPDLEELDAKANALLVALKWTHASPPSYSMMHRLAKRLQEKLDQIPATQKTSLFGDSQEEIIVELDPESANSLGLTASEISAMIAGFDAKLPAGRIQGPSADLAIEVSGSLETLTRLNRTPIRKDANGAIVELGDIATVTRSTPNPPPAKALIAGLPGIVVGAQVRDEARIDWWNREAINSLNQFRNNLPDGIELEVIFDQLPYVEGRFTQLLSNFLLGGCAVFIATLIFLGWRSAVITSVTMPLTCLVVLSMLMCMGIPLHQMSVSGLVIAMGLLIDNAIVVTDKIEQKLRAGNELSQAILESCRFLAAPLIGSTLTTVFSFAPIALMPGATGEFVGTIAVSTILAVVISIGFSLTVVPALAKLLLKGHTTKHNALINPFHLPEIVLRSVLAGLLRFPRLSLGLTMLLPIAGLMLSPHLEEQFFPPADRDQFQIQLELAANASMSETEALAKEIRQVALEDPRIEQVHWFLGESAPAFYYNIIPDKSNLPNFAQALVKCRSGEHPRDVIANLQEIVIDRFPQAHCVVRQLEQGPPFSAPIEILVLGNDLQKLKQLGERIRLVLSQTPRVNHSRSEMQESIPKAMIDVDDQAAYLAGYDSASIAEILSLTLDGSTGGTIQEGTEEIPIRVRMPHQKRGDLNNVLSLHLQERLVSTGTSHQGIPVSAISDVRLSQFSGGILRENGKRCNEIHAFIPAGVLPATVLKDFKRRLYESGFELPTGYELKYAGAAGEQETALGNLMAYVVILGVATVATLVLSTNSFRLAFLVCLVAVTSVGFSIAALWFAGLPFGFMAILGTVAMKGVAINDSLCILAAIQADERARLGSISRMVEVIFENARHVFLTSTSTLAGFLPLYLAGGDFWPPLAICIAAGVLGATFLALFLVPCGYLVLYRFPFPKPKQPHTEYFERFTAA